MIPITGKGYFIWKCIDCEGGSPQAIADAARAAGLTHVVIKIANADDYYNISVDLQGIINYLHLYGIEAWGWHFVYGGVWFDANGVPHYDPAWCTPEREAQIGAQRALELGVDCYIIDVEQHYKVLDPRGRAARYVDMLRPLLVGRMPIGLSSYRYPTLHPQLAWDIWRSIIDFDMPQVYWMQAHNPGEQLRRSLSEYTAMSPQLPYLPTGAAFAEHGWQATAGEVQEFLETAELLGLPGANFWVWDERSRLPQLWDVVANYAWAGQPPPPPGPRTVAVNTGLLNIRNAPVVTPSTLIGQTPIDKEWVVTGEVKDALNRTWLKSGPTAHLAGWLCRDIP
jgi:hypothetical protein